MSTDPNTGQPANLRDLIAIHSPADLAALMMLALITLIDILALAH
jgi:hypothetical protein